MAANRPYITTYRLAMPVDGSFDPAVDKFLNASAFPRTSRSICWATRRVTTRRFGLSGIERERQPGQDVSTDGTFPARFPRRGVQYVQPGGFRDPNTNLNSNAFGLVTRQANSPRQMQLALKLYW